MAWKSQERANLWACASSSNMPRVSSQLREVRGVLPIKLRPLLRSSLSAFRNVFLFREYANISKVTRWIIAVLPALLLLSTGQVFSAEGDPSSSEPKWYAINVWRQPQGLPQNTVFAILQTRDGYIWVGTKGGLSRFDGASFATFADRQLREGEIWALVEGDDSSLWVATYGTGLVRLKNGKVTTYTTKDGLTNDFVTTLCKDREGGIWIGTDGGLSRFKGGHFTSYPIRDGRASNAVSALHIDEEDNVWIGAKNGAVDRFKDGKMYLHVPEEPKQAGLIRAIWRDRERALWVSSATGVFRWKDGKSSRITLPEGISPAPRLYGDRQGNVWIGTEDGVKVYKDGKLSSLPLESVVSSWYTTAMFRDREDNLWIGSHDQGLACIHQGQFISYTAKNGLNDNYATTVLQDHQGTIWLGSLKGLNSFHDGKFTDYSGKNGLPVNIVVSLAEDRERRLWVGTEAGLFRSQVLKDCAPGRCAPHFVNVIPQTHARAIAEDRSGAIWVGTDLDGLLRYQNGKITAYATQNGLASNAIRGLLEDKNGSVWIGSREGLDRYRDGRFTVYTEQDGLVNRAVQSLYLDADNTLWIATRQGLSRLKDGHFTNYTAHDGLYSELLFSLVEDNRHNLWIGCSKGVFHVSKQQLNDFADGKIHSITSVAYGIEHGLSSTVMSAGFSPAANKTSDGRVWFATATGVSVIDPEKLPVNALPPLVHVEDVSIDGRALDLNRVSQVPPGRGDLVLRYTGLSFTMPEKVTFKYKLEGYDRDWIDAGARRTAEYTNIPPGRYRFQVVAANSDGVWNTTGASFEFYFHPHFYQTYWFYSLCALLAVFTGLGAYRWRIRRLRVRQRELERLLHDRTSKLRIYQGHLEEQVAERTAEVTATNEQLRRSQHLLQSIIDNSTAVIYVKDIVGRYMLVNRRFAELFHSTQESVVGKTDYDLFPREQADAFRAFDREVFAKNAVMESEQVISHDDGPHTYISIKGPLLDDAGKAYAVCGLSTDISERKRLEKQLLQAQKMEAIGRLAGGIAHDFNNLLTIITGSSESLQESLGDQPLGEKVEAIRKAGQKASSLTRQLLTFSRRQVLQPVALNLNDVLADLWKMLQRLVSEDIELEINTHPKLGMTRCDPSQVEQVIVNLVVNACDAMPKGGKLTLETANAALDDAYAGLQTGVQSGCYVRLTVTDTGCGMDAETQAHIFEPFFTTKEQGEGTGLGLATVYAIAQQAGGHVSVYSEPGRGTTFHVYFPQVEEASSVKPASVSQGLARGSERVLVVEDQDGVREVVCDILRRNGYSVVAASGSREALQLCEQRQARFDLILTDVVMPYMGGPELAVAVLSLQPDIRVLLMSGYADRTISQDEEWAPDFAFIQKPFTAQALLLKVREVLDKPSQARSAR
jgi:PAS domain S-box-containing protein